MNRLILHRPVSHPEGKRASTCCFYAYVVFTFTCLHVNTHYQAVLLPEHLLVCASHSTDDHEMPLKHLWLRILDIFAFTALIKNASCLSMRKRPVMSVCHECAHVSDRQHVCPAVRKAQTNCCFSHRAAQMLEKVAHAAQRGANEFPSHFTCVCSRVMTSLLVTTRHSAWKADREDKRSHSDRWIPELISDS